MGTPSLTQPYRVGDKYEVVAVCNRHKEDAENLPIALISQVLENVYQDYREMQRDDLDAVDVLVPPYRIILRLLNRYWSLAKTIAEKPPLAATLGVLKVGKTVSHKACQGHGS